MLLISEIADEVGGGLKSNSRLKKRFITELIAVIVILNKIDFQEQTERIAEMLI
jgi:hypothetical protein